MSTALIAVLEPTMTGSSGEVVTKWEPVSDFPRAPCQVWRLRSDNYFELHIEGDFLVGKGTRTLGLDFHYVLAVTAHDDMLGMMNVVDKSSIPEIGEGITPSYRWPMLKVDGSRWLASINGSTDGCHHFILLSLECTIEVVARDAVASWLSA